MANLETKNEKKNPFGVPDGYFDQLTDGVMNRIRETETEPRIRWKGIVATCAGFAAVFMLAYVVVNTVFPHVIDENRMLAKGAQVKSTDVSNETVDLPVFDADYNLSTDDIIEYLALETDCVTLLFAEN